MTMGYPTNIFQSYETRRVPLQSVRVDVATDGSVRGVDEFSAPTYEFTVVHEHVTSSEVSAIEACYTSATGAGSTTAFVYDGDGATYNVIFRAFPQSDRLPGEVYFKVTTRLVGQKA